MFARLLVQSFRRQRRRKLLAGTAVALGVAIATAMLAVSTDIGDKMGLELRTYGANILIVPDEDTLDVELGGVNLKPAGAGAYLRESDLPRIKSIFWRHNILGFAPFLPVNTEIGVNGRSESVEIIGTYFSRTLTFGNESFATGVRTTHPWWRVSGTWPEDTGASEALAGTALARRLGIKAGDTLMLSGHPVRISGILDAGGTEDNTLVAPLALAQAVAGRPGAVRKVFVSALTKPEDEFARRDPASLTPALRDRWYCTPYANSIAFQLNEALPHAHAEQIRQVAQNEGIVLTKIRGLMLLVTLAALLASVLSVSAANATAVLERRREVGLMKAIGAGRTTIALLFLSEASLLALISGSVGFAGGMLLAQQVGRSVFQSAISVQPVLFPILLLVAGLVVWTGSLASIRSALKLDAGVVLRGDA